jgi:hypothetical protein
MSPRAERRPTAAGPIRGAGPTVLLGVLLAGCLGVTSPTPAGSGPDATPTAIPTALPSVGGSPGATPAPPLSLELPRRQDRREVSVRVDPQVPATGDGQIMVTVVSHTDRRIHELVLRWPTALGETLFLAPFKPSEQRIREFGPPLLQDWTKWVAPLDRPGENGEPIGTTSLGWGPLLPGATLKIPILVTRNARGDVAFDLQVLTGESILTQPDGTPAALRVSVP